MIIDYRFNDPSKIFFTSDTHYAHKNIVRGTTEWSSEGRTQRVRDFDTLEEHNFHLVSNINNTVGQDDTLIHLGDWSFGGIENIYKFYEQLICKNIILTLGNHDHHIKNNRVVYDNFRARDLFKVHRDLTIGIGKQVIICHHYAKRVWDKSHKGTWHLYGHSHGTLPPFGKSMDCGVDTHPEFRPYTFNEIKKFMDKQEIVLVDHHTPETN